MRAGDRRVQRERAPAAAGEVQDRIRASWDRSRSRGIDPEVLAIRHDEVDLDTEFTRAGSRVLLSMSDVLAGTQTSLALTDASGTITWRWEADRALGRLFDATEIDVGAALGEGTAGTNGIGVALHEQRIATVFGEEHWKLGWQGWACAAAPVLHPTRGRVLGAINLACRTQDANRLMPVVLRSLVGGVRTALLEAAASRERRLMDAHVRWRAIAEGPVFTLDAEHLIAGDEIEGLILDRSVLWAMAQQAGPGGEIALGPGLTGHTHPVTEGRPQDGCVVLVHRAASDPGAGARLTPLQAAERRVIAQTLARHAENRSEVAAELGISRGTLYERIRRYGL